MSVFYLVFTIISYILIILAALLFTILLAILVIPFNYYCCGKKYDSALLEGRVSWLFGGIKIRFIYNSDTGYLVGMNIFGFKKNIDGTNSERHHGAKEKHKGKRKRTGKKDSKPAYSYLTKEVITKGLQTVLKILEYCKPRKFHVEAVAGFDDPMYTGLLYGLQAAGSAVLDKYNIHLRAKFDVEELEGSFIIGGRIQLFYLILAAAEFLFARPFRSILFKNIKFKIKRRLRKWRITSILVRT